MKLKAEIAALPAEELIELAGMSPLANRWVRSLLTFGKHFQKISAS
jgi:hypothetical protein